MREFLDYYFTRVHTSLPGVVVEYDAGKRRATVQPSLKRRAGNKEYIAFPLLIDVPVQFPGSKKWIIHFPLEAGDEVAVFFSERALEAWKDAGQDGIEDPDPRRYDLCDAYCAPGLQAREFIAATEPGLQIIHKTAWDGDLIDSILIDDDKIEVIRKQGKKDNYSFIVDKDRMETVFKKDGALVARTTVNGSKAEVVYKNISSGVMTDDKIEVKYKESASFLINDNHINAKTAGSEIDILDGNYSQKTKNSDIKSVAPIGLNDGLYITGLFPYLTAETSAAAALQAAAKAAAMQLAALDISSGSGGTITALGEAVSAFCDAMTKADSAAHAAIAKAVK
jgi:hypothetical protein